MLFLNKKNNVGKAFGSREYASLKRDNTLFLLYHVNFDRKAIPKTPDVRRSF